MTLLVLVYQPVCSMSVWQSLFAEPLHTLTCRIAQRAHAARGLRCWLQSGFSDKFGRVWLLLSCGADLKRRFFVGNSLCQAGGTLNTWRSGDDGRPVAERLQVRF
jgi:hypothetical protein